MTQAGLVFIARCHRCNGHSEPIPVGGEPGARWREAEQWSYLWHKTHPCGPAQARGEGER